MRLHYCSAEFLYFATSLSCRLVIASIALIWLVSGQWLNVGVAIVTLGLSFLPYLWIRNAKLAGITTAVVCCLLAAHVGLGMYLQQYENSSIYDKAMHFLGSGAIAGLLYLLTRSQIIQNGINLTHGLLLLLTFSAAISIGTLWEIFEFSLDSTGLFITQHGLQDTMFDLVANTLGITMVLVIVSISSDYRFLYNRSPIPNHNHRIYHEQASRWTRHHDQGHSRG